MTIERLTARHVNEVAALHVRSLAGVLTQLGPMSARAYYAACAESPLAIAFVAEESGRVTGFVLGAISHPRLRRDVLRRRPAAVLAGVAAGALRHPAIVSWLARSVRDGSDGEDYDTSAPELIYLAVADAARRQGVARALVIRFADAMRSAGRAAFELSVAEDNPGAVSFYERLGFERTGRYFEFGRWHLRYRMTLRAPV